MGETVFRVGLLLIFIFSLSACKQQEVGFSEVVQNPHNVATELPEEEPVDPPVIPPVDEEEVDPPPVQPPVVRVIQAPEDHFLGEQTELVFELIPGDYPITDIECSVNGEFIPCDLDSTEIPFVGFPLGDHNVKVVVTDESGLIANADEDWTIGREILQQTTDINVQIEKQKADILFVIDNSASMHEEQEEVARRISNFFNQIKKLNWRVGIITTDPYHKEPATGQVDPYADGVLLQFPNGSYHLDSSMPFGQAKQLFADTIYRPEQGNGHERGIRNTYRSIERYSSNDNSVENQRLKSFYRADATLSVVVISDENETLVDGIGRPLTELDKSKGDKLVDYVKSVWGPTKKFQFNSIVVRTGDVDCIGANESYGTAYENTSRLTNGVIEDICADDYTGALSKIGSGVAGLQKVYDLACQPQDKDGDGLVDLTIQSSGPQVPGYKLNGNKIEFDQPLEEGDFKITYYCF